MSNPSDLKGEELEKVKEWANSQVEQLLGFPEPTIFPAVFKLIQQNKPKAQLEALAKDLGLEEKAEAFVGSLMSHISQVLENRKKRKRGFEEVAAELSKEKKMRPDLVEPPIITPIIPVTQITPIDLVSPNVSSLLANAPPPQDIPTLLKLIQQQKEALQKKIQEVSAKVSTKPLSVSTPSSTLPTSAPTATQTAPPKTAASPALKILPVKVEDPSIATAKIAEIQARVAEQLSKLTGKKPVELKVPIKTPILTPQPQPPVPAPSKPEVVSDIQSKMKEDSTLESTDITSASLFKEDATPITKATAYFDPSLPAATAVRSKRQFKFIEQGAMVKKADKLRTKLEKDIKRAGYAARHAESEKDLTSEEIAERIKAPVPAVEWWDKYLLPTAKEDAKDNTESTPNEPAMKPLGPISLAEAVEKENYNLHDISIYIEHPVPIKPPGEANEIVLTMYLTKKEQKKLRRTTRKERLIEKQERVLLGLEEAPKPKVRIANMMRVLGEQASADPTKIEQQVRTEMAQRIANHEARNQERKLTKEQRLQKKIEKANKDLKKGLFVFVYRITDLTNPRNKFKVEVNAKQLGLTGCLLMWKDFNVVIVEGPSKSQRRYKKLLLQRIDWNETLEDSKRRRDDNNPDNAENEVNEMDNEDIANTKLSMKRSNELNDFDDDFDEDDIAHTQVSNQSNGSTGPNRCALLWEGPLLKQNFQFFRTENFQSEDQIRKFLNEHWSEHLWDAAIKFNLDQ